MAIITWPDDVDLGQTVYCITCYREVPLVEASAGLWDSNGKQAFACNRHFLSGTSLIRGWATFKIQQDGGPNSILSSSGQC